MATFSDCPGCLGGDHTRHVYHWGPRPEGIIDGDFCQCSGDCKERADRRYDEMFRPVEAVAPPNIDWIKVKDYLQGIALGDHIGDVNNYLPALVEALDVGEAAWSSKWDRMVFSWEDDRWLDKD